jgi:hypothetical protein
MSRSLAALSLATLLAACSSDSSLVPPSPISIDEQPRRFVGLRHGTLPDGVQRIGGALIVDDDVVTDFGLAMMAEGPRRMVWLQRITHHDERGRPHWEVLDAVSVPKPDLQTAVGLVECTRAGKQVPGLLGVSAFDKEGKETVLHAWIADRAAGRFRAIPTDGVSCMGEGVCHDEEDA